MFWRTETNITEVFFYVLYVFLVLICISLRTCISCPNLADCGQYMWVNQYTVLQYLWSWIGSCTIKTVHCHSQIRAVYYIIKQNFGLNLAHLQGVCPKFHLSICCPSHFFPRFFIYWLILTRLSKLSALYRSPSRIFLYLILSQSDNISFFNIFSHIVLRQISWAYQKPLAVDNKW